jgi:hypothetical protein
MILDQRGGTCPDCRSRGRCLRESRSRAHLPEPGRTFDCQLKNSLARVNENLRDGDIWYGIKIVKIDVVTRQSWRFL